MFFLSISLSPHLLSCFVKGAGQDNLCWCWLVQGYACLLPFGDIYCSFERGIIYFFEVHSNLIVILICLWMQNLNQMTIIPV